MAADAAAYRHASLSGVMRSRIRGSSTTEILTELTERILLIDIDMHVSEPLELLQAFSVFLYIKLLVMRILVFFSQSTAADPHVMP